MRHTAAEQLGGDASEIARSWRLRVRQEVPAAAFLDDTTLSNGIPDFIAVLVSIVSTTPSTQEGERFPEELREICRAHGEQRSKNDYTLDQVLREYRILRQELFRSIERNSPLTPLERDKFLEAIDIAMTEGATEFAISRGLSGARLREAEAAAATAGRSLNHATREIDQLKLERSIRDSFVSALSHDLRTPLTAAKASSELILRQPDRVERVLQLAAAAAGALKRMDQMIQDLLDANRIRAGERMALRIESVDLVQLVREMIDELSTIHGDRFEIDSDRPSLKGHWSPKDLRRALENLVGNAVKYGRRDSPIRIRIRETAEGGVTLSVHNQGTPIPADLQARLFDRYTRGAESGSQSGWGLGLTIVLGIVKAHGGTIHVSSDAEETVFALHLPLDSRAEELRAAS